MLEVEAGQRGVVDLDVDLDFALQPVALQERIHGGDVAIVLVLGRLERLRLDQDRALEPDAVLVLHHHREEAGVAVDFARARG